MFTYLLSDLRRLICVKFKALGRLVPVSAHALRSKLNLFLIFAHELAQTKVCDLYFTLVKEYVLRFQVVMDYLLLLVAHQVLQPRQDLRNDQFCLFLCKLLVFLQVVVEIRPTAQLENRTEAVVVDLHCVIVFNDAPMAQLLVDLILTQRMLYIVIFYLIAPAIIEVVDFTGDFTTVFEVKGLVDFGETTFAEDGQN